MTWRIVWLYNNEKRIDYLNANSLEEALKFFRQHYPILPAVNIVSITKESE